LRVERTTPGKLEAHPTETLGIIMDIDQLKTFLDSKFRLPVVEGEDKMCSLGEAIRKHVKKGMSIGFAGRGGALFNQLVREFWDKDPQFTIINNGITASVLALIQGRLAKKIIASYIGDVYPTPGPNPVAQKAYLSGEVGYENWTMLTIPQRLLAGAMGWSVIPTRSIVGSSMEEENRGSFRVIDDPFAPGERIGLMKALRPDIALVHGAAADRCGNTIITYPLAADVFGAWAAKQGVVVSAEKIVSTEYIRNHSHLVRIPSYMVRAVCEVPYGAHPAGMPNCGLPEFEHYFEDYDFLTESREASRDDQRFTEWIKYWILDCRDYDEYLAKLGRDRLLYLRGKAHSDSWKDETVAQISNLDFGEEPNSLEKMVVIAARTISERLVGRGYKTILAGVGLPHLAGWLATYKLKEEGHDVDLMAEIGMFGHLPRASDPFIFSYHNQHTCKILNNNETMLGVFVGGSSNQCLGILGAGQIDKYGNGNSTEIPGVAYLVGSGGANDIASGNRETVAVISSGKQRLVEKVPYVTFNGKNVMTLVTDVGIFEKIDGEETLTLTTYIPSKRDQTAAEALAGIREKVGWELRVSPTLKKAPPVAKEEVTLLRLFDPQGFYT
jgi:acyl CoA:acetate/3-ketoacid CoA transferase alpha subunit/acyl CoA:acetate/3-ketoacid CoA transferase beta subunit